MTQVQFSVEELLIQICYATIFYNGHKTFLKTDKVQVQIGYYMNGGLYNFDKILF